MRKLVSPFSPGRAGYLLHTIIKRHIGKFDSNEVTIPTMMKCVELQNYARNLDQLSFLNRSVAPTISSLKPDQALIKVEAASINPFDIEMTSGYGSKTITALKKRVGETEFPLILGRDFSGTVVARGKRFRRYGIGDEVWGVRWITGQGTHARYTVVEKSELAFKPSNLNHVEAASIPYVACTTWNALSLTDLFSRRVRRRPRRVLVPGGTGGIGSFATQLLKAYGHDVITTCAKDGIPMLNRIGITNCLDYTSDSFWGDLQASGPFDVVFDTLNETFKSEFVKLLRSDISSKYVSLRPSLLPDIDEQGLVLGALEAGGKYLQQSVTQLASGKGQYQWGFFKPDAMVLDTIRPLIESNAIRPVIDSVYDISDALLAYKHVGEGHARGKTVIRMKWRRV